MMREEDRPRTKRNHSQNSQNKPSRRSGSRNNNVYASSQRGGAPTLRP